MADIRHATALGFLADRLAGSPLGADKQDLAVIRNDLTDKVGRLAEQRHRFLKINDMDFVALTEYVRCHLWIPETGLMSKMDTRFQHPAH